MTTPRFFGFGSLVNTRTHIYPGAVPATANGWERVWVQADHHPFTFLSARPAPASRINGLVCKVPDGDWAALDQREAGYTRQEVAPDLGLPSPVALYTTPDLPAASDPAKGILLSYIDVVAQGFHDWFGVDGVAGFFATTQGWNVPIVNDRAAPLYPRDQTLDPRETALVDQHLATLGVAVIAP